MQQGRIVPLHGAATLDTTLRLGNGRRAFAVANPQQYFLSARYHFCIVAQKHNLRLRSICTVCVIVLRERSSHYPLGSFNGPGRQRQDVAIWRWWG